MENFSKNRFLWILLATSIFIGLFASGILSFSLTSEFRSPLNPNSEVYVAKISSYVPMDKADMEKAFDKYLQTKADNADRWLTFMGILSTVFAIFFVYAGFKIDSTKQEVTDGNKTINDLAEYALQLQYAMSFILSKQYEKAIDSLSVLRAEPFVLKDDAKLNSCYFFLAHCHFEKGVRENSLEDIARATNYIDKAISDATNPFKMEIIQAFNRMNEAQVTNS